MTDYLVYTTVTSGKYGQARISNTATSQVNMKGNLNTTGLLKRNNSLYGGVYKPVAGAGAGVTGTVTGSSQHTSFGGLNQTFQNSYHETGFHPLASQPLSTHPAWIQIDFSSGEVISMYKIWTRYGSGRAPVNFKLQAWNGSAWDDLDVRTGVSWTGHHYTKGKTFYNNTNIGSYTRYRLYFTVGSSDDTVNITEIGLFTCLESGDCGFVATDNSDCTYDGGFIGVGVTNPRLLLHVGSSHNASDIYTDGWSHITMNSPGYDRLNATHTWSANTFANFSALFDSTIFCQSSIMATSTISYSDQRIKKEAADLSDTEALDKLRLLKPKKYKYVDTVLRGDSEVYGFMAQEVAQVIPTSVSLIKNGIPDIYKLAVLGDDKQSITMTESTDTPALGDTIKLVDLRNQTIVVKVTEVVDELNFKIDTNLDRYNTYCDGGIHKIFVYGRFVEDFNSLDKAAIWTVATAALQELDRQIQVENAKIVSLRAEMAGIKAHLNL